VKHAANRSITGGLYQQRGAGRLAGIPLPWNGLVKRRARFLVSVALSMIGLFWISSARADLVLTADGGMLEVERYEVEDRWARLRLAGGSLLILPLIRIERIVDDEILSPEEGSALRLAELELQFSDSQPVPDTPFGELIFEGARRHRLNPALVAAVVDAESAFDPEAVSRKGARGLMQLMPATAQRFGVSQDQLFDPERNLEAGTRYLAFLSQRFHGDLARILAAYNAGEQSVERYRGVPPFRETRDYIRRVATLLSR
jgi:soluble lytic murein transglycosylase-like protein